MERMRVANTLRSLATMTADSQYGISAEMLAGILEMLASEVKGEGGK